MSGAENAVGPTGPAITALSPGEVAITADSSSNRGIYHTRACQNFRRIESVETVELAALGDSYRECICCRRGSLPYPDGECGGCGGSVFHGDCDFCARFDAVHDVPRNAEVPA